MPEPIKNIKPLGFPWETRDPFLFCVHHADAYPNGNDQLGPAASLNGRTLGQDFTLKDGWRMYHGRAVPGFPSHPHRGFETVTVVQQGWVDHSDSLGAAARYGNGDVQWMTAGKGIQHSEMFPLIYSEHDNPLELFQIWLNLPARSKFVDPYFMMLWHDKIPVIELQDERGLGTSVKIVAGKWGEIHGQPSTPDSWAADDANQVAIWLVSMEPGAKCTLPPIHDDAYRNIYFYKGKSMSVGGVKLPYYHGAEVHTNDKLLLENGAEAGQLLVLQGKPILEPVAQYGPFVMNSEREVRQAMLDYQQTEFGGWPWPTHEPVHSQEKGRFARYADGTVVEKK